MNESELPLASASSSTATVEMPAAKNGRSPLHYIDALSRPPLSFAEALAGTKAGVFCPDRAERRFLRHGPSFIDNPGAQDGFDRLDDVEIVYPPTFLGSAIDCEIIGYRTIVTGDSFFNDHSLLGTDYTSFLNRIGTRNDSLLNEDTGFSRIPGSELFNLDESHLATVDIPNTVISLCSLEPSVYGSLVFRQLPKLASVMRWRLTDQPILTYPVASIYPEIFSLLGIDEGRIMLHDPRVRYRCDHVLVPSMRNNQGYLDRESSDMYASLREMYGREVRSGKKIYVSRQKYSQEMSSPRILMNESEVIARLESLGFSIIFPERLSLLEQIQTFSEAEMVVGPAGSGMFNCVYCAPGTKVIDIESERWWLHAHASLLDSAHLQYGLFIGSADPEDVRVAHRRWSVDLDALESRIKIFGAGI